MSPPLVAADTLWVLLATGLVLLMTPALALFYGGLVRSKNLLNTMIMSIASMHSGARRAKIGSGMAP